MNFKYISICAALMITLFSSTSFSGQTDSDANQVKSEDLITKNDTADDVENESTVDQTAAVKDTKKSK